MAGFWFVCRILFFSVSPFFCRSVGIMDNQRHWKLVLLWNQVVLSGYGVVKEHHADFRHTAVAGETHPCVFHAFFNAFPVGHHAHWAKFGYWTAVGQFWIFHAICF